MTRAAESLLLDFCARQQRSFDAAAWSTTEAADKDRLSLAAMLLATSNWYGHRSPLLKVARLLNPQAYYDPPALVRSLDFDCSRFVHMLRAKLEHES